MEKEKLIYDLCKGKNIEDCENILKKNFKSVRFVDEKIDDGTDYEGIFSMLQSYDVDEFYVRLFYWNDDYIVIDVDVKKQ